MKHFLNPSPEELKLPALLALVEKAGACIMEVYNRPDFSSTIEFKKDESPLTLADRESHRCMADGLSQLFPAIPLMSEEGAEIPFSERSHWPVYWCLDPLDGTKEFINRNGEFTVNLALIVADEPVLGIIYVPVTGVNYFALKGHGCWKMENGEKSPLKANTHIVQLTAVGSKSHASPEEEQVLKKYSIAEKTSIGSSLKFCLLAEGKADLYYRHGPTMEWDTAAGQAIVAEAGGCMVDNMGKPFRYNKEVLRNGSFLCVANKELLEMYKN
ncbi:MAG: 3'(2'),5'-bisphosphate nucleotidase CysQ [Cytophagaceae bacterium]|jgi:3'(2'), 5'-bisphosphate nucleotidase|nr:3'(2'),5'-bisphosphate nucleotidase CysQ [Cytophagaceae bacterium]